MKFYKVIQQQAIHEYTYMVHLPFMIILMSGNLVNYVVYS